MEIEVNLEEAKDFTPVPSASYEVELPDEEDCVEPYEADSGTMCVWWNCIVTGSNGQDEYKGRKLRRSSPLTGEGAGITINALEGFGIPYEATKDPETGKVLAVKFETNNGRGKHAIARVKTRSYDDKQTGEKRTVNDIKSFGPMPPQG
jgi:hypothetical protein